MKKLVIKDERTVELIDIETGEVISTFASRVTPVTADDFINGQLSLFKENEKLKE